MFSLLRIIKIHSSRTHPPNPPTCTLCSHEQRIIIYVHIDNHVPFAWVRSRHCSNISAHTYTICEPRGVYSARCCFVEIIIIIICILHIIFKKMCEQTRGRHIYRVHKNMSDEKYYKENKVVFVLSIKWKLLALIITTQCQIFYSGNCN